MTTHEDVLEVPFRQQVIAPPEVESLTEYGEGEIRPITFWPDPSLKEASEDVPLDAFEDEGSRAEIHKLIADLITTMYFTGGVGLSAPQIGVGARIFVCDPMAHMPTKDGSPSSLLVAINPEIVVAGLASETVRMVEGCLSFPSVMASIERPSRIRFRARSQDGKMYALMASGSLGRIIQHEFDHLDGITFLERMGRVSRRVAIKSMQKFKKAVMKGRIRLRGV